MVAFDTAKVERALREPLGEDAAREVTAALAEGLADHVATKADIEQLRGEIRQSEQRLLIRLGALALTLAGLGLGGVALATALILRAV